MAIGDVTAFGPFTVEDLKDGASITIGASTDDVRWVQLGQCFLAIVTKRA